MDLSRPKPAKKIYHSPEFRVFGDIRELTQAIGMAHQKDSMAASKTA